MLYFRVPFASYDYVVLSPDLAPLVTVRHRGRAGERDQPHRRARRARRGHRHHRRDGAVPLLRPAVQGRAARGLEHRAARRGHRRRGLRRVPAAQLQPGADLHGRRRARCSSGCCSPTTTITVGGRTADQFSGQTYFFFAPLFIPIVILGVPILDTVFSFVRRVVPAHRVPRRRQGPPPPPADAPRARPAPRGRDPLALDRAAVGPSRWSRPTRAAATRSCRSGSPRSVSCSTSSSTRACARAVPARPMRRSSGGRRRRSRRTAGASRRSSSRPVPDPAGRSASDPDAARPLASRVALDLRRELTRPPQEYRL